jgi:hypothetical protein
VYRLTFKKGFAAAELLTLLLVLGVASYIVSGLINQVVKVGQRSTQTGAILEIRSKINSITKNPDPWLNKMRGKYSEYAACIPSKDSPTFASNVFTCPSIASTGQIKQSDTLLAKIAGDNLKIASAPVVDALGDPLAGTEQAPLYLDSSGRVCEDKDADKKCPLKSTGYFMRSNDSGNPGDIRFVVKVEKNLLSLGTSNSGVFKPEYLSLEIGQSWMHATPNPAGGTIKIGYKLDGEPLYVQPGLSCSSGVLAGISDAGEAICKSYPVGCTGGEAVLDATTSELVCASSSNCGPGQVHLGHLAGTGAAMCSAANMSCTGENEVQVGVQVVGSTLKADCKSLPSCADSEILSYDGSKFECATDRLAQNCDEGFIMAGIKADGSPRCEAIQRGIAEEGVMCADGEYLQGFNAQGKECKAVPQLITPTLPPAQPNPETTTYSYKKITFEIFAGKLNSDQSISWTHVRTISEIFPMSQDVWIGSWLDDRVVSGSNGDCGFTETTGPININYHYSRMLYRSCHKIPRVRVSYYYQGLVGYSLQPNSEYPWVKVGTNPTEIFSSRTNNGSFNSASSDTFKKIDAAIKIKAISEGL